ncbi:hypothetical protein MLD38_036114 [Melastoma candidum]|uniref:Uncharacterized protein n=1 Tax=Melastoma candidum TaxID=119954 RepID=A0ACB9LJW5_9MYRT|nr:hypothetical protein MLD38_036114 [Melastoma candidum]
MTSTGRTWGVEDEPSRSRRGVGRVSRDLGSPGEAAICHRRWREGEAITALGRTGSVVAGLGSCRRGLTGWELSLGLGASEEEAVVAEVAGKRWSCHRDCGGCLGARTGNRLGVELEDLLELKWDKVDLAVADLGDAGVVVGSTLSAGRDTPPWELVRLLDSLYECGFLGNSGTRELRSKRAVVEEASAGSRRSCYAQGRPSLLRLEEQLKAGDYEGILQSSLSTSSTAEGQGLVSRRGDLRLSARAVLWGFCRRMEGSPLRKHREAPQGAFETLAGYQHHQ